MAEYHLVIDPGFENCGYMLFLVDGTQGGATVSILHGGVQKFVKKTTDPVEYVKATENFITETGLNNYPLHHVAIERSFFGGNANQYTSYRLAMIETALYSFFTYKFPNAVTKLIPAKTYKHHFHLATGNYAQNKKEVDRVAKETFFKLYMKGEVDEQKEWQCNTNFLWYIGKGAKANHKSDCFMLFCYLMDLRFGLEYVVLED